MVNRRAIEQIPVQFIRFTLVLLTIFLIGFSLSGCTIRAQPIQVDNGGVATLGLRVLAVYPHDTNALTQGLFWHDGSLYESTGFRGESTLRRVDLESGKVQQQHKLPDTIWAEGLARVEDRIIQLSYKTGRAWEYDLNSFEPLREFEYDTEGWGLCYDGTQLWMSNGSTQLIQRDASSFEKLGSVTVTSKGKPVEKLNELECTPDWIYANIFKTNHIVRIDPLTGEISATIVADGLLTAEERESAGVLNGIAFDAEREVFYITGKYWPKLYEVIFE